MSFHESDDLPSFVRFPKRTARNQRKSTSAEARSAAKDRVVSRRNQIARKDPDFQAQLHERTAWAAPYLQMVGKLMGVFILFFLSISGASAQEYVAMGPDQAPVECCLGAHPTANEPGVHVQPSPAEHGYGPHEFKQTIRERILGDVPRENYDLSVSDDYVVTFDYTGEDGICPSFDMWQPVYLEGVSAAYHIRYRLAPAPSDTFSTEDGGQTVGYACYLQAELVY